MQKKVIDIDTAEQIGYIRDIDIDLPSGRITSVTIPKNGFSWLFNDEKIITVSWDEVAAIGREYVLVKFKNPGFRAAEHEDRD